ncbi:ABC transporter permease [Helcococcus kunzii]|uniref:ABC transporter permease n=1 Tax=Helcococcus kunzii TaxID=40091 RepID=UPI001BB09637|nr:ABC transporter permease [Helcococcus kunzii]QUY64073.1 ABC transporter permease [Helcococcus kunzii]
MNNITTIIAITIMYSTALIFGGLGDMISERSGVVNIGIEGMMSIGAFTGAAVGYATANPWIGFLAGGLAGALFGLLHAIASVTFRANQTVSGVAINMLGAGSALFLSKIIFGKADTPILEKKLPVIFKIPSTAIIALLLMIFLWVFIYKTKWGLRLRAVGEHPAAADTLGINVYRTRYLAVITSGFLSGLGGASVTMSLVSNYSPTAIAGQGFIALAAVIFGKWTPHGTFGAAILFGFAQALTVILGGKSVIPSEFISMIPYVLTLVVLVFLGKSEAPKADGVPYVKGAR